MPNETELSPIIVAAAIKGLTKLQAPDDIAPGTHIVDEIVSIKIQGTVTKGEDSEVAARVVVPFERLIAAVMLRAKIGRETAKDYLHEAVNEALREADMPVALKDRMLDCESIIASAKKEAAESLPKVNRAGDTRWAGTCSVIAGEKASHAKAPRR